MRSKRRSKRRSKSPSLWASQSSVSPRAELPTTTYHLQCTFTYYHLLPPAGMGRAGKIHLACLQETGGEAVVCWLVDTNPAVLSPYTQDARVSTDVAEALRDDTVTCVIISTPTPHHAPLIRAALAAGKHVFAEKPLCCGAREAGDLGALAD